MFRPHYLTALALIALTAPAAAAAAEAADQGSIVIVDATITIDGGTPAATEAEAMPFAAVPALPDGGLAFISGRENVRQQVIAENSGTVSGNRVSGQSVTGVISIDSQAFQNLNGLSILTANTGNNVSINASMNVNVSVQH